jgi:alpha-2-macroglobulin
MRWKAILPFFVFAIFLAPANGQGPAAYFSISTNKTFLPGEKIGIRLYATNVDALEFRVYKVKDPIVFFERLDNPHGFGHTSMREQIETPTLIERFHDWKYELWVEIRDFFRMQFSARSRAGIRESQANARKAGAGGADVFAQAPVLNSSQLVARWRQNLQPHYISATESVPVESLAKGVYVVEATDGSLRAYTLIVVSDLGIITKAAPGQVLAYASDRRTGAPVPQTEIRVWSDKKENTRLNSDMNGLAETPFPLGKPEDIRVVAVHGDDFALVTPYSYNLSSDTREDWTGYVYTDRPVYRPGHSVHFKVILRTHIGERYQVPAGESVQVLVEDPSSKLVLQSNFPVSGFGTIHGDLELAAGAALGYYSISVRGKGGERYPIEGGFHVEEYKKPEYEVKVNPSTPRVLEGDFIEATVEAKYYFGEPVAGAAVKYVVHTSTYYAPFIDRDEGDDSSNGDGESEGGEGGEGDESDYAGEQVSEQSARLDADGRLKIRIPTRLDEHSRDVRYRIEARVTDEANREIAGHNSVIATYGSFAVGISAESYVFKQGEIIRATAVAKDYDGHPIRTSLHVELTRMKFANRRQEETVIGAKDFQTGEDGSVAVVFPSKESGNFFLRVTARTPENREVKGETWVWVTGAGENWWGGQSREIRMVPDKKSYKPGETAHVLVLTGVPDAYLLVTTEARTIQSRKVVHATGPSATLDIPIESGQQPNVYVSVAFLRDNNLYQANRNLKVPADQQKLRIEIQPAKTQFAPGQKGSYTIQVRDAGGKPVVTELSLGVVDEAIYAIQPESSGDIMDTFYGPAYDRVSTNSSLGFYFSGEAGKREMFLAHRNTSSPRALAQLKPETLVQPRVRKVFPDTALWLGDLRTDANGRAEAQLTFPDSLTSWRATVRGVTQDTKVGSVLNNVIVRKNLMVRIAAPRFFRQGDEVTVSAIVHNYLPTSKTVQLSIDVKGLDVLTGSTGQVQVPSKGDAKLDWRVRARSEQDGVLQAKALTDEESDAMEITLPVIAVGVKQTDAKSGSLVENDQEEKTVVTLPGNPDHASPSLDITLNSSYAGSIFAALEYLTSYPYGCTEQTMSSFLPNIVVAKALKDLQVPATVETPALKEKIEAGMARLKDYQHEDGGWGWWKDDESQVFMTSYVVSGFGQSTAAGYGVDAQSLQHAENWLHATLIKYPNMRPDLRAYVVYALASNGAAKPEELQVAWDARGSMTAQGLSMLGLTYEAAGDAAKAQEIASKVESLATVNDREVHWSSSYDYFMEFATDDDAETTAYAVRFLSTAKPQSTLLPKAVFWLASHRNGGYFWDSTKQTAMVIFGLTQYLKASRELNANFHAEVYVNGKQVASRQFTAADSFNPAQQVIHLNASQLQSGPNEIRIHKSGSGRLYWSASGSFYSSEKRLVQNNSLSLNIARDYFRLSPQQTVGKIVYQLDPLQGDLHVGDILAVRVTVSGSEWRYLLMEDPIPAGAEFIQRDDLYELNQKPSWWQFWFSRREFHDDRAAIFQTYSTGTHEYTYLLKIVNPGRFQVSPAMVQPMYQPSVQATSDAIVLEVK